MTLETQVLQRFILGFEGLTPPADFLELLSQGLGGVIFFRENFQQPHRVLDAPAIAAQLATLAAAVPASLPTPFLSIDQEGGQVERLPYTAFPTTVSPYAVGLQSDAFAHRVYEEMARRLALLGFNMNFFPTLDVNLEPANPIIGVRAFGETPETVARLAKIAMAAYGDAGVLCVGKHFPGHGNGTVDSHLDLPVLRFTEAELAAFQAAIAQGLPAMMVAHGLYPDLQATPELPASLSPEVIQRLLRERCGFQGVVMTDDLCMGAITRHWDPLEAALLALQAGVDVLLYKQSTGVERRVIQGVIHALETGRLDRAAHEAAVERIVALKSRLRPVAPVGAPLPSETWDSPALYAVAMDLAQQAITVLHGAWAQVLPLVGPVWVLHPDRRQMGNYAYDVALETLTGDGGELPTRLAGAGVAPVVDCRYGLTDESLTLPDDAPPPETVIFVAFNAVRHPQQVRHLQALDQRFPHAKRILVSAGMPSDATVLPAVDLHIALCSYRPASLEALAKRLASA